MKHKIAIVDDHTLLLQAISGLVNQFENFTVMLTCNNGRELIDHFEKTTERPDIILMDIKMPLLNGIETTEILQKTDPKIPVIALTVEEDEYIILKMLKAGAKGYLIKDTKKEILEFALQKTIADGFYYSNDISNLLVENLHGNHQVDEVVFNDREQEFIQHACTDLTYKEIADKMFLSPKTIDKYRESVFVKINAKNRIGMVLYAIQHGIYKIDKLNS